MQLLKRVVNRIKIVFSDKLTQALYFKGIPLADITHNTLNKSLQFIKLNCEIPLSYNADFLINSYGYAKKIKETHQAKFIWTGSELHLEINNVIHHVQTEEDIFILYEIHVDGVYNYVYRLPHNVFDIGMNVSFSSLYFAGRSNVVEIHSFEPFKPTFNQALKNQSLNPEISKKIKSYNFGLGEKDESLQLKYNYDWKGSAGIDGIPDRLSDKLKDSNQEIEMRAVNFLDTIKFSNADLPIGVKIDCEGAEYAIVKSIILLPFFDKVQWVLMEWHEKVPLLLLESLTSAGFSAISLLPHSKGTGMIYAFRQLK